MGKSRPASGFLLVVDGAAYGRQRFGGLITYWDQLLTGLDAAGVPIELTAPAAPRCPLPTVAEAKHDARQSRVFHSTHYTLPTSPVDATVLTVHDMIYQDDQSARRLFDRDNDVTNRIRACIDATDTIVVPSASTAERLRAHHPDAPTPHVIPHGVRDEFRPRSPSVDLVDGQAALPDRGALPYLLHVGGRESYKDFLTVLDAYLASPITASMTLVVVGSQAGALPDEEELIRKRAETATITFLGQVSVETLAALYRHAAVVVSASRHEGFGLPMVEAAASGTPIACSRIPVYEETVGDLASFFEPGDVAGCREAILQALDNKTRARESARQIRERFDWHSTITEMIALYEKVTGPSWDAGSHRLTSS